MTFIRILSVEGAKENTLSPLMDNPASGEDMFSESIALVKLH